MPVVTLTALAASIVLGLHLLYNDPVDEIASLQMHFQDLCLNGLQKALPRDGLKEQEEQPMKERIKKVKEEATHMASRLTYEEKTAIGEFLMLGIRSVH